MDHGKRDTDSSDRRLASLIGAIVEARNRSLTSHTLLAGISGIDGSGKGYITERLDKRLRELGWKVAAIPADDWLNLRDICINQQNLAAHFHEHALRLDEMFKRLLLPLKQDRQVDVIADCGDAWGIAHRKKRYAFSKIDIVLVEGIFLFKRAYRDHFDLKVWIECSFETALQRAIARGQEGLPPAETAQAFETIYFPAQRLHFERDKPHECADIIFDNDGFGGQS